MRIRRHRVTFLIAAFATALSLAALARAGGPPGGLIYANDEAFRTVGTPTDLPDHGKFDTIYVLGAPLANVSNAAPGDREFNGGRWEVRTVTWLTIAPTQFTNAHDVEVAAAAGQISIGPVVKRFECPLIPAH